MRPAFLPLSALVVFTATPAAAADFGFGVRWEVGEGVVDATGSPPGNGDRLPNGYAIGSFGPYFHALLGLDVQRTEDACSATACVSGLASEDASFVATTFGFSAGVRVGTRARAAQQTRPFLELRVFKYVAALDTDATLPDGTASYLSDLASPIGFDVAGGAHYMLSDDFGIGVEALGLRYQTASGTLAGAKLTRSSWSLYSAIVVDFFAL